MSDNTKQEELRLKVFNAVRDGVKQVHFTKNGQTYLLHVDAVDDVMDIINTQVLQAIEKIKSEKVLKISKKYEETPCCGRIDVSTVDEYIPLPAIEAIEKEYRNE